jgi:phosphatidylethanolamine/phosphatidyl-N-methylethanolamine N-methyltransferase
MNAALFLRTAIRRPATMGAIMPSSRHLASAMSAQTKGAGLLVELGAGTGAVTRALRAQHPQVPLVAVEAEPTLAARLRLRFPEVDVRGQCAHEVLDSLHEAPQDTVLVSSLPFRSLPGPVRSITVQSVCDFLERHPGRRLVQYTYQPRPPFDQPPSSRLAWHRVKTVWRNAPPAGVWVLA